MKFSRTLIASSVAAVMAAGVMAPAQAEVEVGASVGVANMYYWRGFDLGNGDAAVWGDLNVSASGAYGGIWASSGDVNAGTEYDVYVGYGGAVGDFSYDLSAWSYVYPSAPDEDDGSNNAGEIGELSEVILSLGYGPVAVTYYDNVAGNTGDWYTTLGVSFSSFGITYGLHETDYAHIDLSYAYNDNLSFTIGLVADDVDGAEDDDAKFIVSYTLPLGE